MLQMVHQLPVVQSKPRIPDRVPLMGKVPVLDIRDRVRSIGKQLDKVAGVTAGKLENLVCINAYHFPHSDLGNKLDEKIGILNDIFQYNFTLL